VIVVGPTHIVSPRPFPPTLQNQTVKVVGSGHSWSPLGLTPSYMVNLDKFDRILEIDAERKRVRVEAGIRIRDLSAA
jgi:FAD/FMN-containing dehydrogenase